jgi:hypothetical protein
MRRKKVQVALDHDGRPPLLEEAPGHLRKHSACQSIVADLTSIVSAAHKLPAEVDRPARVWASLRAQPEKEGILSCSVRGEPTKANEISNTHENERTGGGAGATNRKSARAVW